MPTLLQTLKLSSTQRTRGFNPVQHRRNRFLSQISEQIEAATAEDHGQPYAPVIQRRVRGDDGGAAVTQNRLKQVRRWWWLSDAGVCFLELRYGVRALEIAKGKTTVEVGDRKKLVTTLEVIRDAVLLGEFDDALQSASNRLGAQLGSKRRSAKG